MGKAGNFHEHNKKIVANFHRELLGHREAGFIIQSFFHIFCEQRQSSMATSWSFIAQQTNSGL